MTPPPTSETERQRGSAFQMLQPFSFWSVKFTGGRYECEVRTKPAGQQDATHRKVYRASARSPEDAVCRAIDKALADTGGLKLAR